MNNAGSPTAEMEEGFETDEGLFDEPESVETTTTTTATETAAKTKPEPKSAEALELDRLRAENVELQNTARFWSERAQTSAQPTKKETPVADEPKLNDDIVEALSSNDPARITKVLGGLGFVRRAEVEQAINTTTNRVVGEQTLLGQYPDLKDKNSEMFKTTARHYNELKADPDFAKSTNLTAVAARLAAAELGSKAQAEPDSDRAARVSRQTGDRGRRPSTRETAEDGGSDELSAAQKAVLNKFIMAGANVSEEGYKKRAQTGVRMGGAPTRRK